jgi:DNA-binding SARP family transcriptional activator
MEYAILGRLEVVADAGPVRLGPKERTLLGLLLVRANRVVAADTLAEELWDSSPPPSARKTLQTYVSHLRRAIGAGALETLDPGYRLLVDTDALDATRFEELVESGRRALGAGDARSARAAFDDALALWRGPALGGCMEVESVRAEAVRLTELRLAAEEDRFDATMAAGEHRAVVGPLEAFLQEHPFRERAWGQLMVALYRSDRQAEALAAYRRAREMLVEELGVEPGDRLRELERLVLEQAPGLRPAPDISRVRVPLPAGIDVEEALPFVGREGELAALEQAWVAVRGGRRRVVFVCGEPGAGKSRLVRELARGVCDEAGVLAGRCDEGLNVPYQPFAEALRHFTDHCPDEPLLAMLGRYAGDLVRLLPELGDRAVRWPDPLRSDPDTERYRLLDALASWLSAVARAGPLLLILEDLHWATRPTLVAVRRVLRPGEGAGSLVVVTYRDTEPRPPELQSVLAECRDAADASWLRLEGLDVRAVEQLLSVAAGDAERVRHATGGNPLFLGEVLRNRAEAAGGDAVATAEGVRDVVRTRVRRLGEDVRALLDVAAVAGVEMDAEVLRDALGWDERAVEDVVAGLQAAHLLVEAGVSPPRYAFAHTLVRDALYDDLAAIRRVRLHRAVAGAIERTHASGLDAVAGELARHLAAAGDARAVGHCLTAGERALARHAPDEAAAFFDLGLGLLPDDAAWEVRCDLLTGLGEAQRRAGGGEFRETLLRACSIAEAHGDGERVARAAVANNRGYFSAAFVMDRERVAALEAALTLLPATDRVLRARALATLATELSFSPDAPRRFALADEALAMARRLGDEATLVHVTRIIIPTLMPLRIDEAVPIGDELLELAGRRGDPSDSFYGALARAFDSIDRGDGEAYRRWTGVVSDFADLAGHPHLRWTATWQRVQLAHLEGRLGDAEALATEGLRIGRDAGNADAETVHAMQMFFIRRDQGRLGDAELSPLRALRARAADPPMWWFASVLLALAHAEAGRMDEAAEAFGTVRELGFGGVIDNHFKPRFLCWAAAVCTALGDRRTGAELLERLLAFRDRLTWGAITPGAVAQYAGDVAALLGRHGEADDLFAEAEALHERVGAPVHLARTRLCWARALLARGEADRARALATMAIHAAREHGAAAVARAGAEIMSEADAAPRPASP